MDKRILTLFFMLLSSSVFSQGFEPHGFFHKDSVKIGEELPYSLWIRYPKDNDLIFPDSLFDYKPFELDRKEYFNTKSDSIESVDSIVYYFSTFELDTVQSLVLPVFIINEFDSTILYTQLDSIILNQVVIQIPDSVAVLVNTSFQKVPLAFNYPYLIAGLITLVIVSIILFFVFGKKIRHSIQAYWLSRKHKKFIKTFTSLVNHEPIQVEELLSLWKRYLERLISEPVTKLTSKELVLLFDSSTLKDQLNIIDRTIYASDRQVDISNAFNSLMEFSVERYHIKIKEIKNG